MSAGNDQPLTISVDVMGGDRGPGVVVKAMAKALKQEPGLRYIAHGPAAVIEPLIKRRGVLQDRVQIVDAERVVEMTDKPSVALRNARGTSMWAAVKAVADGHAQAAVSCGNTGALMAMSMLALRKAEGIDRPAIAAFWPSRAKSGFSIALDMGADVRAEPETLQQYAVMGAEYARIAFSLKRPRVALLNVGAEEGKGRPELRAAREMIEQAAEAGEYQSVGYAEGGDVFGDWADVIVTDGFTGNIALKTAEGAAGFIGAKLKETFTSTILARLVALAAFGALRRFRRAVDPRRANGGVFLGLRGAVVKSHGGADATGVTAAITLAARMGRTDFAHQVAERVARLQPALPEGLDA